MRTTVFQEVMPCNLVEFYQRFGGMYLFHGRGIIHIGIVQLRYRDRKNRCSSMSKPMVDG
jgi:hypothetical protein